MDWTQFGIQTLRILLLIVFPLIAIGAALWFSRRMIARFAVKAALRLVSVLFTARRTMHRHPRFMPYLMLLVAFVAIAGIIFLGLYSTYRAAGNVEWSWYFRNIGGAVLILLSIAGLGWLVWKRGASAAQTWFGYLFKTAMVIIALFVVFPPVYTFLMGKGRDWAYAERNPPQAGGLGPDVIQVTDASQAFRITAGTQWTPWYSYSHLPSGINLVHGRVDPKNDSYEIDTPMLAKPFEVRPGKDNHIPSVIPRARYRSLTGKPVEIFVLFEKEDSKEAEPGPRQNPNAPQVPQLPPAYPWRKDVRPPQPGEPLKADYVPSIN